MDAKLQILKETFENEFSMHMFTRFTREFFNTIEIVNPDKKNINYLSEYAFYIASHTHVANYADSERNRIAIFAVELRSGRSIERARSMQRNFISKLISNSGHDAAIVAFYIEGEQRWRLSLVRLDYEFAAGRAKMNITPAKRYSYLMGKDEPCHTAMEQLFPIFRDEQYNPTLDKIEAAFSIETVTKEFFDKYENKYSELKKYLDANRQFSEEAQLHQFTSEQFAKKLMGQLAFLYFLQKKGWLGVKVLPHTINEKQYKNAYYSSNRAAREIVPKAYHQTGTDEYKLYAVALSQLSDTEADVLAGCFRSDPWGSGTKTFIRELYDACSKNEEKNFFDDYLEPLFYEALNRKRGVNLYYKRFNCKIPFLNGGLFEPLENYDWEHTKFGIPDEFFSNRHIKGYRDADGILDIFDRYNFTMNEDEPLEREVAVDPEMLGKIFENLLDAKDRKSKGAFYTPREIVHYMCQESLINYLANETDVPYEDMKEFILYGELMKDEDCSKEVSQGKQERRIPESVYIKLGEIDKAMENVKVADPAVGSGAFPLGMLSEIIRARCNITEYFVRQIHADKKFDRKLMYQNRDPYRMKWDTIKNCIFAVDIEASAVDIAKLRLWLSLVVDQEVSSGNDDSFFANDNKDPHPLPNLDYNIMCGNSLMDEFEGVQLFDDSLLTKVQHDTTAATGGWQISLFSDTVGRMTEDLFKEQDRFFGEEDTERKSVIKKKIDKIIDDIIRAKLTRDNNTSGLAKYNESLKQKTKPYFLWKLECARIFREKGGFDIVIGNPPYVLLQDMTKDQKTIDIYKNKYTVASYKIDLYHLFIERGINLLNDMGVISYITPSNFTTNNYCINLRMFMLGNVNFRNIILYDDNVFDANVNNLVFVAQKPVTSDNYIAFSNASIKGKEWVFNPEISQKQSSFMNDDYILLALKGNDFGKLLSKMEMNAVHLDAVAKVNFGMQLRDRKKFTTDVVIGEHNLTDYHKPCYTGKDILQYVVTFNSRYCYFNREEAKCGGCWDEDAHNAKNKLLVRQIGKYPIVAIDTRGYAILNTAFMINVFDKKISPFYLLGLLNSTAIKFYWLNKFSDNRKQFPKIKGTYLGKIPIPLNLDSQHRIECEVKGVLEKLSNSEDMSDLSSLTSIIDSYVFELYGISAEEQEQMKVVVEEG